ncbi:hypothetical protein M426DRAFT_321148 [Hypoxylon sp. CI-4A]|nr:hypothetical protein M426DRAFT_321148 [Hypoxylon sp. CI-4A]
MQSLWSRVAQAQSSCRCRICLHPGRSLVRRSTNAAARRKATAADLFTACYTTILGAATVIDANRKEAKKREIDEKLEKARAALNNLGVHELHGQQGERAGYSNASSAGTLKDSYQRHTRKGKRVFNVANALLQELGAECEITRRPLPQQSWMQTQLEWLQAETAISQEERDPEIILREPRSTRQLQEAIRTVVDLVEQLMNRSEIGESVRSQHYAGVKGGSTKTDDIWGELQKILHSSHYPSYHHPLVNIEETTQTRSLLGESIRCIFNQAGNAKDIVAKICYNLLTCSALPSIHTYNALIAGFNRIQRPDLAQEVINSYIHNTRWPATQQTMVCLLDHYRGIKEVEGFRDSIKRMRGVRSDGLHFQIIDKDAVFTKEWLDWARQNCASRKRTFVQRAQRGDEVFNSIIKGWLYCGEVGIATMAFVACLRNGNSVSLHTLQELFTACLSTVSYAAAWRLVRGFAKNLEKFTSLVNRIIREESPAMSRQMVMSILHLLNICQHPHIAHSTRFATKYEKLVRRLKYFLGWAQLRLEIRETADLCRATFQEVNSIGPLYARLDKALITLDSSQQSRQKVMRAFTEFDRAATLFSIFRTYENLETMIKTTTAMVKVVILKLKSGCDLDPSALLATKQRLTPFQQHRHNCLFHALENIQICSGPMTQENVKLQLLQHLPDPILARNLLDSGNPENLTIRTLITLYRQTPAASKRSRGRHGDQFLGKLEQELADTTEKVKAVLFAYLGDQKQKNLRHQYQNWYQMPFDHLVKYHMQIISYKMSETTGRKQTVVVESRDQKNPAIRTGEQSSMALEDAGKANGIVPRRPATKHADVEKGLHLTQPIKKLRSAGPSVLRDEDVHPPLAALG